MFEWCYLLFDCSQRRHLPPEHHSGEEQPALSEPDLDHRPGQDIIAHVSVEAFWSVDCRLELTHKLQPGPIPNLKAQESHPFIHIVGRQ